MQCADCGASNALAAKFCAECGIKVAAGGGQAPNDFERREPAMDFGGAFPAHAGARSTADAGLRELYAMAIGPKNQDHYVSRFDKFEREGKTSVGWHWPAFFLTFYWLIHRKMYGKAVMYMFLPYIAATILAVGAASIHPAGAGLVYIAYLAAIFVLPAMYADAMYYRKVQGLVRKAQQKHQNRQAQIIEVARAGQTSNAVLVIVGILFAFSAVGILAAIALPAYQEYTVRAKTAQALTYGKSAALAVGNYYEVRKTIPSSLSQASFDLPMPPVLQDLRINTANGVIRMVLAGGTIAGQSIELVPTAETDGHVTWKCVSSEVRKNYLPLECRK